MASTDFTIADVLAWARTKPAGETYDYCQPCKCAIAQFLRDTGRSDSPQVDPWLWSDNAYSQHPVPHGLDDASCDAGQAVKDWTFGGFASRLEALVAQEAANATA